MKIKMKGSELNKVDIEFLSLVKRGANRAPFKVIKAEAPEQKGLLGAVKSFFSMSEPNPSVVAIFVEKSALLKALPNLADAGFDLSKHEIQDDCVVFKQTGFEDADTVIMLKSEQSIGFAVASVSKYADIFSGNLLFDPAVETTGFYPGLNMAMGALQKTVGDLVSKDDQTDTDPYFVSYETYAKQIVKALPTTIWKFESLQRGFGGVTTDATVNGETVVKTPSEVAKAAEALAEELLTSVFKDPTGASKEGIKREAAKGTGSSSSKENANSSTSTSELAGSKDDSPDDEAARRAKKGDTSTSGETMTKAAASSTTSSTTSSNTTSSEEDLKKGAQGKGGPSTTSSTSSTSSEEGMGVKKGIRPIVFKNADGTEYHQAIAPNGLIVKFTPGAKIPEGHTTMTEEWEQHGSDGNFGNENGQGKGKAAASEEADNELKHTGAGGLKKEEMEALLVGLAGVPGLLGSLAKSVEAQGEMLKKTIERVDSVEKSAQVALKKAETTVIHVAPVHDSAFENLGGGRRAVREVRSPRQISKAEFPEEVWEGVLGVMERHIPGQD